jgi:hypothetical protein
MTEPPTRQGLPWAALFWSGLLAAALVILYRGVPGPDGPIPWKSAWAATAGGVAVFLVLRWLQNTPWGLIGGALLALHPLVLREAGRTDAAVISQSLVLAVLAGTVAGWRLSFEPGFAWRFWPLVGAVLLVGNALAWPIYPRSGLLAGLTAAGGLLAAAVLATRRYRRPAPGSPGGLNIVMALGLGVAGPLAALALAPACVHFLDWHHLLPAEADAIELLQAGIDTNIADYHWQGFTAPQVQRWGWPAAWLTGVLMIWGFWRSIRRGWRLSARRQPPTAWLLTGYAVLAFVAAALHSTGTDPFSLLTLAALGVLLAVFGVADLVRGFMERLVLAPPQEREV